VFPMLPGSLSNGGVSNSSIGDVSKEDVASGDYREAIRKGKAFFPALTLN
jgi:hypothetical protein